MIEDKPQWAKLGDRACEPEKRVGDEMPFVPVEEKIRSDEHTFLNL